MPSKSYLRKEMRRYLSEIPDAMPEEKAELKAWVEAGNHPFCNPTHIADEKGCEMPFIHGLRAEQELYEMMMEAQNAESPGFLSDPNSESD